MLMLVDSAGGKTSQTKTSRSAMNEEGAWVDRWVLTHDTEKPAPASKFGNNAAPAGNNIPGKGSNGNPRNNTYEAPEEPANKSTGALVRLHHM
jgi:hypothetical protein